jgi:anaerobic selenocysteine-containing dehydrogenase
MTPPLQDSVRQSSDEKTTSYKDRSTRYTFCDGCNHVPKCGIVYRTEGSIITHVRSRRDFDYPADTLCAKGYAQLQEHYQPDRLKFPLMRTTPKGDPARWARISWDEALALTAQRLNEIKQTHGADRVCFFTGDPKEMRAPLQRLSYCFGSPNYGTESSTCFTSIAMGGKLLFGQTVMGNPPGPATRNCFIWGANPAYSRPVSMKGLLKSKRHGVSFFVVDPRKTPTGATLEATHLAVRPGTDGLLALGMIGFLVGNGLHDKEFVGRWVHNFEALEAYVRELSLERVSSLTGVPVETIKKAALAFAEGPTTIMLSAAPVVHHTNGNRNIRALLTLVAVTGNLDREGGVAIPWPPLLAPDTIGDPRFCRRNDLLPPIKHLRADADDFPVWAELVDEIQMNRLPDYVDRGSIRGMVMFGGNAKMWPQPHLYQAALAKLDFSVAADLFYRPWTHDFVDLLLPAATCFERTAPVACFGNSIYARQPMKPLGEAREDWQIIADLGVALGFGDEFHDGNVEALVNETLEPAGVTLAEIKSSPGCMVKIQ